MTTILHITRMNFLSNKAHVYTTAKTCEALAEQNDIKVILLSSDDSLKSNDSQEVFFQKHGIKTRYQIVSLSSLSNKLKGSSNRLINWLETLSVNLSIALYVLRHRNNFDVLYFRDSSIFAPILISKYVLRKPIFMELHAVLHSKLKQWLNDFFAKISVGLIAISYGLKEYYDRLNKNSIVSFCAAAEPDRFVSITQTQDELRKELGLPQDKIILLYTGNMGHTGNYDSYGIEDIVETLAFLDDSIIFVGVGKKGNETQTHEDLAQKLGVSDRALFLPWVDKSKTVLYRRAADVLVLPASGAQVGNSPTKMFTNLAAERPIVSARTQAIEEVLVDKHNALLVTDYKDPERWAEAINQVLNDESLRRKIIAGALEDSAKYTWAGRGRDISKFILEAIN